MAVTLTLATEKQEMRLADRAATLLGFVSVHFSQARASKQTPGIPDRLYLHPQRGRAFWWEAKRAKGKASPAQMQMASDLNRCGHVVVIGTADGAIDEMQRIVSDSLTPVRAL